MKTKLNELNEEKKRLIKKIEELIDLTVFPPAERSFSMTRKRKMESTEIMNTFNDIAVDKIPEVRNQSESNLCGHSCKRFREDGKPNARTTYTIVDTSDSSLVSNLD